MLLGGRLTVGGGAALGPCLHRHAGGLAQAVAHGELQAHDAGAARCKVVHYLPPPPHHRPARQPLLLSAMAVVSVVMSFLPGWFNCSVHSIVSWTISMGDGTIQQSN